MVRPAIIPTDFDEREVFTFYGLAVYKSCVLERAVMTLFVATNLSLDSLDISQDVLDRLFAAVNESTLGTVFKKIQKLRQLPNDVETIVREVIRRRNSLVHHFFWDNSVEFLSEQGRRKMLSFLSEEIIFFESSEEQLRDFIYSTWEESGISREQYEAAVEELVTNARDRTGAA